MNCQHCHAETTNGLALCELCRRRASDCLEFLPVEIRNLARWKRSGRPNGSIGTEGQWLIRRGESEVAHIRVALDRAANDLDTWTRALADDRPGFEPPDADTEVDRMLAFCEALATNLTSIATLEWAGQFVRDMDRHEYALRRLTETYIPGWYAGECRRCQTPTFVMPGLTWVTCGGCGATTFARDHLDTIIEEASDWRARPMRLAEALVALLDTEQSIPRLHKRISKWGERGRIDPIDRLGYPRDLDYAGERYGPKQYRLGDVLDLLRAEGATQLEEVS